MTIAVVDDFKQDRMDIADFTGRYLREHDGPSPQFFFYSSGEDFIIEMRTRSFDIVLLDCCMDGMDGMQTAQELRRQDKDAALIFITSCRDYAVGGYLVSAAGYLLKPYTYDAFTQVFGTVYNRHPKRKDIITVMDGQEKRRVLVDDIVYCDISGHYAQIHMPGGMVIKVRMTFSDLFSLLSPYPQFLECYRGCLINMAHTCKAEELNFLMDTGERVPFRKKEHGQLLQQYSNYLFDKVRSDCL